MQLIDIQAGKGALATRTLVLTADKFEDLELIVPYFRLLEQGGIVDIAAPAIEEINGEHGYRVMPDLVISDADPDRYDLLLVPGGFPDGAPATVRAIPAAQAIARSFLCLEQACGRHLPRTVAPGRRRCPDRKTSHLLLARRSS